MAWVLNSTPSLWPIGGVFVVIFCNIDAILDHLGAILGHLGAILGQLRPSWGLCWPSWGHLGPSWGHLGAKIETRKHQISVLFCVSGVQAGQQQCFAIRFCVLFLVSFYTLRKHRPWRLKKARPFARRPVFEEPCAHTGAPEPPDTSADLQFLFKM